MKYQRNEGAISGPASEKVLKKAVAKLLPQFDQRGALAAFVLGGFGLGVDVGGGISGIRGSARGVCTSERFVNNHFQISLIAQAALGGLHTGLGDVVGVEANCG